MNAKKEDGNDDFLKALDMEIAKEGFKQQVKLADDYLCVGLNDGKSEDLEQAIFYYEKALQSCDRMSYPKEWVKIKISLSVSYVKRIAGDPVKNSDLAIKQCEDVLLVTSREVDPKSWSQAQLELALAHRRLVVIYKLGKVDWRDSFMTWHYAERMFHSQKAITHCQNASEVYRQNNFLPDWAISQLNLGTIYCDIWEYDRAISCFETALTVLDFENFPAEWIRTQINLGNVYFSRDRDKRRSFTYFENALKAAGNRKEFCYDIGMALFNFGRMLNSEILIVPGVHIDKDKILEALSFFLASLKVFTPTNFPEDCLQVGDEIGMLANRCQLWDMAIHGYGIAISAIEFIYDRISSGEARQEWLQKNIQTYRNVINTCIASKNYKLAVEFVERSKNKNLIKEIESRYPSLKSSIYISFDDIQSSLDEETALIEWHVTAYYFDVFVITSQEPGIQVLQLDIKDRNKLQETVEWVLKCFRDNDTNRAFSQELNKHLKLITSFLHMEEVLKLIPENCKRLVLVPHRFLHLLPIHALPLSEKSNDCLLNRFSNGIFYVPSFKILKAINQRKQKGFKHFFAVQDPDGTLPFASLEVEIIKSKRMFSNSKIAAGSIATKGYIKGDSKGYLRTAHCVHFACHGKFLSYTNIPEEAYLNLANEERLDLKDVISLDLQECRLVTLSACETAVTYFESSATDEYIGLASGFILAGSSCVIGSLWKVNDVATAILMIKLYEIISDTKPTNLDISVSLNKAQNWLRSLSHENFQRFLKENDVLDKSSELFKSQLGGKHIITQHSINKALERQPLPFEDPYYWAPFIAVGY